MSIFSNSDYQGGKLSSLILKEGNFQNFKLEIVVIPPLFINFKNYKIFHCFLEQYHLLNYGGFNLDIQLVVNFRSNQGEQLYLYNKDKSLLLYQTHSKIILITDTGISHATITKYKDKSPYLDSFHISGKLELDAKFAHLSSSGLRALIDKHRPKKSCLYYLYNKDFSILYFIGNKTSLQKSLKIYNTSVNRSVVANKLYLNTFQISEKKYKGVGVSDMNLGQLNSEKRKLRTTTNRPVYIYNKDLTILYYEVASSGLLSSLLNINVRKGDSIKNYIGTGNPILNFKLSYNRIFASKNKLLTLNKMKQLIASMKSKVFGYNKQISIHCIENDKYITVRSIRRTVSYLRERGINTTAATIKKNLEKAMPFQGFFFKYIN